MSDLRIALIGAGTFGRKHIDVLAGVPGFTLAGIADPDAVLAVTRPDGAIVATPNALHLENGIPCLRVGVPVLVEKPVADTPEAGAALAEVADQTGCRCWSATTVGTTPFWRPPKPRSTKDGSAGRWRCISRGSCASPTAISTSRGAARPAADRC